MKILACDYTTESIPERKIWTKSLLQQE